MDNQVWRKLERVLEIEYLLRHKKYTVSQLAERIHGEDIAEGKLQADSAKRNMRRDLAKLCQEKLGRGIIKSADRPPTYEIRQKHYLDDREALAVYTAARLFFHHAPSQPEIYQHILRRLCRQLPEHLRDLLERQDNPKTDRPKQLPRTLEIINSAWVEQRKICFKYLKPGGSGTWRDNTVSIYFCEISRTNLDHYIIGYEETFQHAIRTFKLSRIDQAHLTNQPYHIPPTFDPAKYLSNAWGIIGDSDGRSIQIKLRFHASVIHRLEEGGYPNMETLEQHPDGSRTIAVRAGTNREGIPLEVLVWARSWGANVEILEPAALRQLWLEDAKKILSLYGEV